MRLSLVFDKDDFVRLLAVKPLLQSTTALIVVTVNLILRGKRGVTDAIAKALRLRKVYVAE
jgi:hypothetical protein